MTDSTTHTLPAARLAPITKADAGAATAAHVALLLLLAAAAYLAFVILRPLPATPVAQLQAPPTVEEARYAPINDTQIAALVQTIDRSNILTPDRGPWRDYFRPENATELATETPQPQTPTASGQVDVDDPDQLPQDVKAALTALMLTGIYAPTDGQVRAEFFARHTPNQPSFSVIPGEQFQIPRTPNGQLDTWTLLAIERQTNRVVIQGLGANVPLALFGTDVDTSPITIDPTTTIAPSQPVPADAAFASAEPEDPAQPQPIPVERATARDIERMLREQQEAGYEVNIADIFRLMNVNPNDPEADPETESNIDPPAETPNPENPEPTDPAPPADPNPGTI